MPQTPTNHAADLQGLGRLATDAVIGVTDIAESLHHTIGRSPFPAQPHRLRRTRGITGFVYRTVRAVTRLVGRGIDGVTSHASSLATDGTRSPQREAVVAALNGVVGDYLAATNNPLAIDMQFRRDGVPLDADALREVVGQSDAPIVVMVHGLAMNDRQWERNGHDHGAALARDLGATVLYVHYNTGRQIATNGRQLADLLETLADCTARPLQIVGYSMGGLVTRAACHFAQQVAHRWLDQLDKIIFLGTPHHGSPLERGGNWIDTLLDTTAYSTPFGRLGKIRSAGITDLRYGQILADGRQGHDRFRRSADARTPVPLPTGVRCYAIAGTLAGSPQLGDHFVGDGLVPLKSGLGVHRQPELTLPFPSDHRRVARGVGHLDLLSDLEVYTTMRGWLSPASA